VIQLPVIQGELDRRILLNYRFDPASLAALVPAPFAPRIHKGFGIGGVCMIRFRDLRPRWLPRVTGVDSENAAHRIAVEWTQGGERAEGVFIPQRDTASAFNHWAGGKVFPGVFQRSEFDVRESNGRYHVEISRPGEDPHVVFDGEDAAQFGDGSVFETLDEASEFFAKGAVGYSASGDRTHFQGMELRLLEWHIRPLRIHHAFVRLYEDGRSVRKGAAELDSAMVMLRLKHEWHRIPTIPARRD
jgi:hypothetical protein